MTHTHGRLLVPQAAATSQLDVSWGRNSEPLPTLLSDNQSANLVKLCVYLSSGEKKNLFKKMNSIFHFFIFL